MFGLGLSGIANLLGMVQAGGAKFWAIVVLVVLLTFSLGGLYLKHTHMIKTVAEQKAEIAVLESKMEEATAVISRQQNEMAAVKIKYEEVLIINKNLKDREVVYDHAINELEKKLTKAGRDIGYLANMKPDMMEKIVNKASRDRSRCFEVITGKPKLEGEKNEVCPHLFVK